MKKRTVLVLLTLLCLCLVSAALAVEFPCYGACTGEKVNIRVEPENMYPSKGQLIHNAPLKVLGEKGDAYLCSTYKGEGYVPKQYVKLFEGMTDEEYKVYCSYHPNEYRKYPKEDNWALLELYYSGKISLDELKANWKREPGTGYYGLRFGEDGWVYPFRGWWW